MIKAEGKLRVPRHQRRLQLLKAKRSNDTHSDFLYNLESLMSVAEFNEISEDKMIIHLFCGTADQTMSKIALEILGRPEPSLADLRQHVKETENSIW